MKTSDFFQTGKKKINQALKQLIVFPKAQFQKQLFQAAAYALFPGGKRLRPLLVLATVKTFKKDIEKALIPACSLELIHTYSLVHDDLPCMDNDDLRHGKPSLHKAYPEWLALLTGDFFLTYAFEILTESPNLTETQKLALIQTLSHLSGGEELLAGQFVDLTSENKKISFAKLKYMHEKKTASLISAAIEFGAIIAGTSLPKQKILRRFGQKIGLAYQMVDDLLETITPEQTLGKSVNSDKAKGKANVLAVIGSDKTSKQIDKLYKEALKELNLLQVPTKLLQEIACKMLKRSF